MPKWFPRMCAAVACAGLCAQVAAQDAPLDTSRYTRVDASSGLQMLEVIDPDDARATPDLADELVRSLGQPWEDVRPTLPPPDSSAFEDGLGEVWWSVPGFPVDGFRAFIQRGRVESVTLDFAPDGPDLAAFARRLYDRLGSPRADGFYATDQTGYPYSLALDAQANRMTARAVPGQTLDRSTPLPIQFSTVPAAPDSVHTYVSDPPEVVGGLAALQEAVVYPEPADGVEGVVYVQLVVETDGAPSDLAVVRSPDPRLEAAALEAVRAMRFEPGRHDGRTVRVRTSLPVRFVAPQILYTSDEPPRPVGGLAALNDRLEYPRRVRRNRTTGRVVLAFIVEPGGSASGIEIAEGTRIECGRRSDCAGDTERLQQASVEAVQNTTFHPAIVNGRAVRARYQTAFTFSVR